MQTKISQEDTKKPDKNMSAELSDNDTNIAQQIRRAPRRRRPIFSFLCVTVYEPDEQEIPPAGRYIESDGEVDLLQIYTDWIQPYKQHNPNFNIQTNKIELNTKGVLLIFRDPQAEEDLLRHIAEKTCAMVFDKGIHIATLEYGQHIDPRTNQEFPENEYTALVEMLASGKAYSDIPSPRSTISYPF